MVELIFAIVGFAGGALAMMVALDSKRKRLLNVKAEITAQVVEHEQSVEALQARERRCAETLQQERASLLQQLQQRVEKLRARERQCADTLQQERASLSRQLQERLDKVRGFEAALKEQASNLTDTLQLERASLSRQLQERLDKVRKVEATLNEQESNLDETRKQFDARVISYQELEEENAVLKGELRKLVVGIRKLELDRTLQQRSQESLDTKVQEIGSRYLAENVKWIGKSLNASNFASCKQRLMDVIEKCREIGFQITEAEEGSYVADLRVEYQKEVRAAFEREEQARIKAQIREELRLEREIQREQERIAREKLLVEAALAKALASTADQHSAEIESLKARLAAAEEKERVISQAQLTKAGFVYVISNIGSFGEGVYKIGMTRRLEPQERVRELGDASVPFPFDVHMMISCQNAPALENALHKALLKSQLNKTNPRKEFFRSDIETIVKIVTENHGEVKYIADAEALQYRQSLTMSDEDLEFIEHVFDEVDDESEAAVDVTPPVEASGHLELPHV